MASKQFLTKLNLATKTQKKNAYFFLVRAFAPSWQPFFAAKRWNKNSHRRVGGNFFNP